jgi:hypothetical protein
MASPPDDTEFYHLGSLFGWDAEILAHREELEINLNARAELESRLEAEAADEMVTSELGWRPEIKERCLALSASDVGFRTLF